MHSGFHEQRRGCALGLAFAIVILGASACLLWWLVRPIILTKTHSAELMPPMQRYLELTSSIEGWRDPTVISRVATGKRLEYLLQNRCINCSRLQVTTTTHIVKMEVLDYSPIWSTVGVRVEQAWHLVNTFTGEILGGCHVQTYSEVWLLKREAGEWKIADGADAFGWERNAIDDSPELRAKYCPLN